MGRRIGMQAPSTASRARHRLLVAATLAVASSAVAVGGHAGVVSADPPFTLGTVNAVGIDTVIVTDSACNADGSGTFTFTATSTVTGSFPGTMTETGTVVIAPPVEQGGATWNPVTSYASTFTITSPVGTVDGATTLLEPTVGYFNGQTVNHGTCISGGNRELTVETTFTATITQPGGTTSTDQGVGKLFAGVDRFVSPANVTTSDLASTPVWATPDPGVVDVWVAGVVSSVTNANVAAGTPYVFQYSFEKSSRATSRGTWGASFPTGSPMTLTIGNSVVGATDGIVYLYGGGTSYVLMPNGSFVSSGDPLGAGALRSIMFTMDGDPGMTNGYDLPLDPSALVANSRALTVTLGSPGCVGNGNCDVITMSVDSVSLTPPVAPDTTPPTVSIATPAAGATYDLGQTVTADYSCADDTALAAVDGCVGTVASGGAIDTSTPGAHPFSVTATDAVALTSSASADYTVSNTLAAGLALTGTFTTIPADASVSVVDEGADGVTISVTGTGTAKVVMSICGGFTARIAPGSTVTLACGSVIATVTSGSVEIDRTTPTGVVTMRLTAGGRATIGNDGAVVVSATSTSSATVTTGGVQTTVAPGKSVVWRVSGFDRPVSMGSINTVEARSTVPLKFEIFYGRTEIRTTTAIASLTITPASCTTWTATGTATPISGVRYDRHEGEFRAEVRMPSAKKACYRVTMTATSGLSLSARFRTK